MRNHHFCHIVVLVLSATIFVSSASARSNRKIDDNDTVTLRGNVHHNARPEFDRGDTDPSMPMERMVISLRIPPDKQADLDKLLAGQQDHSSANYHRWLTPEEFGVRFSPSSDDISAVTGWLTAHGFTVDQVSRGRTSINFSGSVSHVERAFRTKIHNYNVDGKMFHANNGDPSIPRGLADLVGGVVSLHNFPRKSMISHSSPVSQESLQPNFTNGIKNYLSPGDFAIIYNVNPLYNDGYDGTGQSIAIVGRAHPPSTNWDTYRSMMGLPVNPVQVIVNGDDPVTQDADENGEADLDVEWSGAVAKNATIKFVTTKSTTSTDGVDLSAQYIVNNNLAAVMSTSFGLCESLMGTAENSFYNNLWQQAAAQGITAFVSSGDAGAAGCSSPKISSGSGLGVNGLGSSPYNVAVGGTQFNDGAGGYWNATNVNGFTSAISYIPEIAWNESGNVSGGTGLWSSGGGGSIVYTKPSWQTTPGVPADNKRYVPDVSLSAASHDGYLTLSQGGFVSYGGTSASSPSFAGIMALIVQKTGQRQGNANIRFYQLANAQYGSGGAVVYHDTTTGSNSVPGVAGFSCSAGYDQVTGLGSVDAYSLASNWALPVESLAISSTGSLPNGTVGTAYNATLSASGGVPPYTWSISGGSLATGLSLIPAIGVVSGTPASTGVFSPTLRVTDSLGSSVSTTISQAISSTACVNWPVRAGSASPVLYPDFFSAYPSAASGDLIQLQALDFSADFLFDHNVSVILKGGYDCGYSANASVTGILGKLRVSDGTVKVDKLRFR